MGRVGDLSALHEKYFARGLRVVGISHEPVSLLTEKVLGDRKGKFWIGSDPQLRSQMRFVDEKSTDHGIPRFYLVDVLGKVVGQELPSTERIEELLREVFDPALDRSLHERLGAARKAYEAGAYAIAHSLAERLEQDEDTEVAEDAKFLTGKVGELMAFTRRVTDPELEQLLARVAYGRLMVLKHQFAGMEIEEWVRVRMAEYGKSEFISRDAKAWKALDKALGLDLKVWRVDARRRASAIKRAIKEYERLDKKHRRFGGTRVADRRIKGLRATLQALKK